MKRSMMYMVLVAVLFLIVGMCNPPRASAQHSDPPVQFSIAAIKERTQVGVGFQREWLSRRGVEAATPTPSWVAVIPASYNVTPSTDIVAQFAYNMTSRATRYVIGVRFVVIGGK